MLRKHFYSKKAHNVQKNAQTWTQISEALWTLEKGIAQKQHSGRTDQTRVHHGEVAGRADVLLIRRKSKREIIRKPK